MSLDNTDSTFVNDLKESDKFVDIAIDYYFRSGYERISKPELKVRPNVFVCNQYSDRGDFKIIGYDNEFGHGWVDAKHLSQSFPPFKYKDIIVVKYNEFSKNPCWEYFLINKEATHAIIFKGEQFRGWTVIHDVAYRGRTCDFYTAPISMGKVVKL